MNAQNHLDRGRLELAVSQQRAGRLREAAAIYQDLLRRTPNDADVMQRLGVTLAQLGYQTEGVHLLTTSLQLQPDRPTVLLNLARALLALGRAEEALRHCDRALALDGSLPDVHRLRAAALGALGQAAQAQAHLGEALRRTPADAAALVDLGVTFAAGDRVPDAIACFERAIGLDAQQASAHHNLALLTARMGDHERALRSFDLAVTLRPQDAALHNNRGSSLKELGRLTEALQSFSTALAIDPMSGPAVRNRAVVNLLLEQHTAAVRDYLEAFARRSAKPPDLIGLGVALLALGRHAEALEPLEKAVALLPEEFDAHVQRGVALLRLERHAEAVTSFDRALAIRPGRPEVLNNRGVSLTALGRANEALRDFVAAAALASDVADTHTNMGVVFKSIGDYTQAARQFDRALALRRDDPAASFESAFLQLTLGNFRKGWPLYEARFRVPALAIPPRDFAAPRWDGSTSLARKTVLVHAEQGLGDTIQFCRYVPLLLERGASVVFETMPQLTALMGSLGSDIHIVARGEPLPRLDVHCPLLSLPLAFDTQESSIPRRVPYLAASPERVAAWATRLLALQGLRVGIAWQGNPQVERSMWARGRSIPLAAFAPLTEIGHVDLVSLQKGFGREQLLDVPFRDRILDLGEEFDGGPDAFLDSAAVMSCLDLVITSDTAIAHLAGALGRPVWVALSASADWRWLLNRADSPWYPTMRLFRRPGEDGGWTGAIAPLSAALRELMAQR